MAFSLKIGGRSDRGRVRARNEDAYCIMADLGLAVVADGMGGHPAGAEASARAVESFLEHLTDDVSTSNGNWGDRMATGVEVAHRELLRMGDVDPERRGMGTTLTALRIDRANGDAILVHVGDSRAYRLREGRLTRISRDHTWVQEQVEHGRLDAAVARVHPMAHVLTRVVGGALPGVEPQVRSGEVRAGDRYLLCTDGLTTHLSDDRIAGILANGASEGLDATLDVLVRATIEEGATDNVTVILVNVEDDEQPSPDDD